MVRKGNAQAKNTALALTALALALCCVPVPATWVGIADGAPENILAGVAVSVGCILMFSYYRVAFLRIARAAQQSGVAHHAWQRQLLQKDMSSQKYSRQYIYELMMQDKSSFPMALFLLQIETLF